MVFWETTKLVLACFYISLRERMEKALTKVGSLKVGNLWITKKAKEEFSNISEDISVSQLCFFSLCLMFLFLSVLCKGFTFSLLLVWHCPCVISGWSGNFGHNVCNVAWFNCTQLLFFFYSWVGCQKLAVGWEICWFF